jgi:hypothetical protein
MSLRRASVPKIRPTESLCFGQLRNHGKAKSSEITVKSKRRHVIEKCGYNYK